MTLVTLPRLFILFATIACFLLITLALVLPVFAQDATSSTTRKETTKQRFETKKEVVKERLSTLKERMATREAALKTKLAAFRDRNKANITERINTNLNMINAKQTKAMSNHLVRMSEILTKVEARKGSTATITTAKERIASATALVNAQAEKDYTITVTSEAKIKDDAKLKRDMLHTDLKAAREAVIAAKQAVAATIREAKNGQ